MTVTPSSAYRGSYATIEPTVSCPEAAPATLGTVQAIPRPPCAISWIPSGVPRIPLGRRDDSISYSSAVCNGDISR